MRKRIDVSQLEIGMYVTELDRPWLGTPFLFQGFEIRTQDEIDELRRYCKAVFVDIADQAPAAPDRARSDLSPRTYPSDAEQRLEHDVLKIVNQPRPAPVYHDQTTVEQEINEVKSVHAEARALVQTAYEDARLGRILDANGARRTVTAMVASVLRNPDALSCFALLKRKDAYTALHSLRVSILALTFGRHLGLDAEQLHVLGTGALLHDIGKVKVPSEILNKPGRLDEREYALMRAHVPHGVEILMNIPGIPRAAIEVARCHHERYNGGGYIEGLQGDAIGFFGMIGGIVDCYDAITSDRAYHAGMASHAALKRMYEWRMRDFHPNLVEQFIQCIGIYPIGSVVELNSGEIGVVVTLNRVRRLKPRVTLVLRANCTPLPTPLTIDLMHHKTPDGRAYEVERVLEPGVYGIDPIAYLPVHTSLPSMAPPAPRPARTPSR